MDPAEETTPTISKVEQENETNSDTNKPIKSSNPSAIQIVSIGNEADKYAFTFHEEAFMEIMSKIPPGWKISVVSVVGAFRTGKSFLLSWFLRYLHHLKTQKEKNSNAVDDPVILDGEGNEEIPEETSEKWYEQFSKLDADSGFHWRGGSDRNTTGIWMWSEPFFVEESGEEPMALVLVDTQGMFDHETTMGLTAAIFGLSTLLSSFQIYNVDKNIQEDNLQQLALFTEYGRMVMAMDDGSEEETDKKEKPFQRMEFLVRDWQHFEADEEEDEVEELEKEMSAYLDKVLAEREHTDLSDTREQILSCFEDIQCFMLTHPGSAVTKKKYDGDTDKVDPVFLKLLDRFCEKVLGSKNLKPKTIRGRALTVAEFGVYVKAFAKLFADGAQFPEAATMLEATAAANNTNAVSDSMKIYKEKLDALVGPDATEYIKPEELEQIHSEVYEQALKSFDLRANFGSSKGIERSKRDVMSKIKDDWELYSKLNEGRNPFGGLEM